MVDNILIDDRNNLLSVKLADFGLSEKYLIREGGLNRQCGTLIYMAPEVALDHDYTKSVDMWAIGIIMYFTLTGGKHPLYITYEDNVESYKRKLQELSQFEVPSDFSWLAKNLFLKLTKIS